MNYRQSVSRGADFAAPAQRVWDLLMDWGGLDELMPDGFVRSLELEGQGIGAVRHIVTGRGVEIHERLDRADARSGRLELTLLEPLPWGMRSYSAFAQLDETGPGTCHLHWEGVFELPGDGEGAPRLAHVLGRSYETLFKGIRMRLETRHV